MSEKTTIYFSKRLLISLFLGYLSAILIVDIVHTFGYFEMWSADKDPTHVIGMDTKVESYKLYCPFGNEHYFKGSAEMFLDFYHNYTLVKMKSYFFSVFEGHNFFIFFVGTTLGILIYFSNKFKIRLSK